MDIFNTGFNSFFSIRIYDVPNKFLAQGVISVEVSDNNNKNFTTDHISSLVVSSAPIYVFVQGWPRNDLLYSASDWLVLVALVSWIG